MDTSHLNDTNPLTRGSMFDYAVERLINWIDEGDNKQGDKLPSERELVEILGVSRSVLREALRVLEYQGIIAIHQGKGVFVRKPGLRTVIEPMQRLLQDNIITLDNLMQARLIIEPQIARMASLAITEDQIRNLERDFQDMNKFLDFPEKYTNAEKRFHNQLANATGNPVLLIMNWPIITMLDGFLNSYYVNPGLPREVCPDHELIIETMKSRDPDGAERAMRIHLNNVIKLFKDDLADRNFFP